MSPKFGYEPSDISLFGYFLGLLLIFGLVLLPLGMMGLKARNIFRRGQQQPSHSPVGHAPIGGHLPGVDSAVATGAAGGAASAGQSQQASSEGAWYAS